MNPDGSKSLRSAEREYQSYRRRLGRGEKVDFDAFCAAHPDIADGLRFLHSVLAGGETIPVGVSLREVVAGELGAEALDDLFEPPFKPGDERREWDPGVTRDVDAGGRYLFRGEVGRGGMSRILEVWDRELGRSVAMKIAQGPVGASQPGRLTASGAVLERLLAEAYVTARLEHPGIVPVYDCGVAKGGQPFFTMRLVRGTDFREVMQRARESRAADGITGVLGTFARISETVAFAHAKGVVHRDLKPNNVRIGSFGETYVMDWGLAKIIGAKDRHAARLRFGGEYPLTTVHRRRSGEESDDPEDPLVTPAGTIAGTPVFMPPEQAAGHVEKVNPSSDIYALGAILYTILAGRPPYVPASGKASPLAILGEIVEGPPQPIAAIDPGAPKELVAIAEKAMARAQEDRYASALELAEEVAAFGRKRAVRTSGGRLVASHRRTGRAPAQATRLHLAGAGLLIALLAGTIGALSTSSSSDSGGARREESVLAELQRLADFETAARELGPASSANVAALSRWVDEARAWTAQVSSYRELRDRLRDEENREGVVPHLDRLVRGLDVFLSRGVPRGTFARVEHKLEFASEVRRRTIDDAWSLWQEAIAAIRDETKHPLYRGIEIVPQEGLIPLGPDPRSGLWEFAHLETGRAPERGEDGALRIDRHTGLVLVLIPGDSTRDPFFLSKYAMSKAQWARVHGEVEPEELARKHGTASSLDPVTVVSSDECERVLRDLGLEIPVFDRWRDALAARAAADGDPDATQAFGLVRLDAGIQEWCVRTNGSRGGERIAGFARVAPEVPGGAAFDLAAPEERRRDVGLRPARALVTSRAE